MMPIFNCPEVGMLPTIMFVPKIEFCIRMFISFYSDLIASANCKWTHVMSCLF
jgi:hypothetical protein